MESRVTLGGKTARTLGWNSIDKFASQLLYAVTGIVLANVLPKEDFGLVGAILVFQAFGILFVDSGFGAALLQKKEPTQADYSTVLWFNLAVSVVIYAILYLTAPLIARLFQNSTALIPLSRVMFLSFIINGLSIVQTNRLMKAMDVKHVAIANLVGLTLSGALGICLALHGAGAWALVWQTVALAFVRCLWLWITGGWLPSPVFSLESIKSMWRVGLGVFSSSLLNTIFLHIYSFVIGVWSSMLALGVYTQADKWSKMGSASLSQIVTATYVPLLSRFQDDMDSFRAVMKKVCRLSSFFTLPLMGGLVLMAAPLFHTLFREKWDAAIPLFQILTARGILVVYISLLTNCLLSLGYAKSLVVIEGVKDASILLAIVVTLPVGSLEALVWGQMGASALTFIYALWRTARATGVSKRSLLLDLCTYLAPLLPALVAASALTLLTLPAWLLLLLEACTGLSVYLLLLAIKKDPILAEAIKKIKKHK